MNQDILRLSAQINALKNRLDNLSITGGHNVLVSKTGNDFSIDAFLGTSEVVTTEEHPFRIITSQVDDRVEIYVKAGTINGFLAQNFGEVVASIEGTGIHYVFAHIKTDSVDIESIEIVALSEENMPDVAGVKFFKDSLPTEVYKLIGVVSVAEGQSTISQVIFSNLKAVPKVGFTENSDNLNFISRFWGWDFEAE
jgi:hypothetical protein